MRASWFQPWFCAGISIPWFKNYYKSMFSCSCMYRWLTWPTSLLVLMHSLKAGDAQKTNKQTTKHPRIRLSGFSDSWGVQHLDASRICVWSVPHPRGHVLTTFPWWIQSLQGDFSVRTLPSSLVETSRDRASLEEAGWWVLGSVPSCGSPHISLYFLAAPMWASPLLLTP